MKKFLLLCMVCCLSSACQNENSNSDDAPVVSGTPEFLAASAIMAAKCTSCHAHNFHQMTEAQFVSTGRLVPGDAPNSSIYYRLTGAVSPNPAAKNMPTDGNALTSDELTAMVTWINSVAP